MTDYFKCVVFVGSVLLPGIFITTYFGGSSLALAITTIVVLVISSVMSASSPLDGEAVDRVYYMSAMLGAWLFFYAQSVERTEFLGYQDLAGLRAQASSSQDLVDRLTVDVENGTGAAGYIEANTEKTVRAINRAIAGFRSLKIDMTAAELDACFRSSGLDFGPTDFGLDQTTGPDLILEEQQREMDRALAEQACSAARTRVDQERLEFIQAFPIATEVDEVEEAALAERGISQSFLRLGGFDLTVEATIAVLKGEFSMDERINELEVARTNLNQDIEAVREKNDELAVQIEAEKERSASFAGQVSLFLWPYVLIALLGLKLARAPKKRPPGYP